MESTAKIRRRSASRFPAGGLVKTWIQVGLSWSFTNLRCASALPQSHPLRGAVDQINAEGPFVGVLMAYQEEEKALMDSGAFLPRQSFPWIELSGRRFHIGSIRGVDVITVMSGQRRLNAGITVQMLLDVFELKGIVHYGTAGSANDSLSFGNVIVPKFVAFTGSWHWMKFDSEKGPLPELPFAAYNVPAGAKNLLSRLEFKSEEFFSAGRPMEEVFWLEVDTAWYRLAAMLQGLKLKRCENETYCLPVAPRVVFGLKGSTADVFVDNAAYRDFLFGTFNVSTVDEESAAVVMTAMSTGLPAIVFRGVSDLAGGGSNWSSTTLSSLAAANALTAAVEFVELVGKATVGNHRPTGREIKK